MTLDEVIDQVSLCCSVKGRLTYRALKVLRD